jgi:hypothetical protein
MKLWSATSACAALLAARLTGAIELNIDDTGKSHVLRKCC